MNTEVTVDLPGAAEIVSVVTKDQAEYLALEIGHEVYAVMKASNGMIAVD